MFTGLVKEIGKVQSITKSATLTKLGISSSVIYEDAKAGDSVCVNGVCLTIVDKQKGVLFFDAVKPTLLKSNLKRLKRNDPVNLEPALKLEERVGGHFVLGHIDIEAPLRRVVKHREFYNLEINLDPHYKKFVVENGSIALEGVSLTIKQAMPSYFSVSIIPFTYEHTTLKYKRAGSWLNVEFDYLLKKGSSQ